MPRFFALTLAFVVSLSMTHDSAAIADDKTEAAEQPTTAEPAKWAIAIHGGAGGDPESWEADKRQKRQAGLRRALETGRDVLAGGGRAIDAVEQVIRVLEDDAHFNAGRGAVLTTEGHAELDASIMDGSTAECGAVAGVGCVKNPISLARRVMTETEHVLLVGPGAEQFARQQQVPLVQQDYFLSRYRPQANREVAPRSAADQPPRNPTAPRAHDTARQAHDAAKRASDVAKRTDSVEGEPPHFGTVGCVALDVDGHLAAGTSTGGTKQKLPGRVGDSPIVGAGTYAADDSCAVSGTGIGEEYIRHVVGYDIAAQMRYAGRPLERAVTEIMTERLDPGTGGVIAVSHQGRIVLQYNTDGMSCGAADSTGRFETHLTLPDGGRSSR